VQNPRQLAFLALRAIHRGAFADVALDRALRNVEINPPDSPRETLRDSAKETLRDSPKETLRDRGLVTELVYGTVRRQRSLDALISQLAKKRADQQPPDLRSILHLGLYQLRYLSQIPAAAAVNSTVELAKQNGLKGLTGLVNGLLRQYIRLAATADPLQLPEDPIERLGVLHSYPDWIVAVWLKQIGLAETERLCTWLNQPPYIDLRVNPLQVSVAKVASALEAAAVSVQRVPYLPQALRLLEAGSIPSLPGFTEGWWSVQDSSAQLVSYLVGPQPGEVVIDACAAPGGKTTHLVELMQDQGTVWACDRAASRLKKLQENTRRLNLNAIQTCVGDSRNLPRFVQQADRVLLDAPCSGLGTLHRHADARWRQTPETVQELTQLQGELLEHTATWVKPGGILVYATCTLHPDENEAVVQRFLHHHPDWSIDPPAPGSSPAAFTTPEGWIKVWPHRHNMDGFFMVRLSRIAGP